MKKNKPIHISIGTKVLIKENIEGNICEPFVGLKGITTPPFNRGCKKEGWLGVKLDTDTIYGTDFNFHINELEATEET